MRTEHTTQRQQLRLTVTRPSAGDMFYMFLAIGAASAFFFLILMPFLAAPALQIVAIAAGTVASYLIRYSPRIVRRASLALAYRQSRGRH